MLGLIALVRNALRLSQRSLFCRLGFSLAWDRRMRCCDQIDFNGNTLKVLDVKLPNDATQDTAGRGSYDSSRRIG